jgi:ABC-type glycerol-3-phosphate transport system substrate-binding protein
VIVAVKRSVVGRRRLATRRARAAAMVGVAGLLLAACGSSSSSAPASSGATSASGSTGASKSASGSHDIVWWNMWSGAYATMTKTMAGQFDAAHPGWHVSVLNVPAADGDTKLLSAIAAGDPPDMFTEWNPTIGGFASNGAIQPLDRYLTGKYAALDKWMYPVVRQGGVYKGKLYAIPMSMNSEALFYNKSMLKAVGVTSPPKTLAELDSDQAKEWKLSGSRLKQVGFYPLGNSFELYNSYFQVPQGGYTGARYSLSALKSAKAEAAWLATYAKYPNSAVTSFASALGQVGGGSADLFSLGKEGFEVVGPWEAVSTIPDSDPSMDNNFGVEPFPSVPGGASKPSAEINGNYNIVPKGAKNPTGAIQLAAWLAGYENPAEASYLPTIGWMPPSPQLAKASAFVAWEKKDAYVKVFLDMMLSPSSQQMPLNPQESAYNVAAGTALQNLATKKMSPQAALSYIDAQAAKG